MVKLRNSPRDWNSLKDQILDVENGDDVEEVKAMLQGLRTSLVRGEELLQERISELDRGKRGDDEGREEMLGHGTGGHHVPMFSPRRLTGKEKVDESPDVKIEMGEGRHDLSLSCYRQGAVNRRLGESSNLQSETLGESSNMRSETGGRGEIPPPHKRSSSKISKSLFKKCKFHRVKEAIVKSMGTDFGLLGIFVPGMVVRSLTELHGELVTYALLFIMIIVYAVAALTAVLGEDSDSD